MHQMVLKTQNTEIKSGRMCVCVLGQVFAESGKMFLVNWRRRRLTYNLYITDTVLFFSEKQNPYNLCLYNTDIHA